MKNLFIKISIMACVVALSMSVITVAFAQNNLIQDVQEVASDSTVTVILPSVFDFSTVAKANYLVSMILAVILQLMTGFWAKGNEWLTQKLPKTSQRVGAVALLSAVIVNVLFGFNHDAVNFLVQTFMGILLGQLAYDKFSSPKA